MEVISPDKPLPVDFWPHPLTTDGRCVIVAVPGKTLREVLEPHLSLDQPAVATINGELVVKERWGDLVLREGDVVQARVMVQGGDGGSNPIAVVLSLAVLVAAPYLAGFALTGQIGGFGLVAAETALGQLLTAAIGIGGILIVNSLFPPRLPDSGDTSAPTPQYSISGGANRARPYEPLQLLLGQHRLWPDFAAREYTEYDENDDQFLNQIFDFGLGGNLHIENIRIGESLLVASPPGPQQVPETTVAGSPPLTVNSPSFEGVQMQFGVDHVDLVSGNVDTIAGGDFETQLPDGRANGTPFIIRTTADNTTAIAFDLVFVHFLAKSNGDLDARPVRFNVGWRRTGTLFWTSRAIILQAPEGVEAREAVRRSYKFEGLPPGAYDLRVRLHAVYDDTDDLDRISFRASVPQMRAYQDSAADFTGRNPLALRIKASGQLYGRIETINADGAQLIPAWNGSAYIDNQRTSNPADILLWWLRGYRIGDTLVAGYGLEDEEIDFEALQGWHAFCVANGLECNIVLQDGRDEDAVAQLICQCGWGRFDISTGKHGVLWENDNQPTTAVVTPSNIIAGTLSVSYDNENLADEISGAFIDRDSDYKENELRRPVPNPTITGEFPVTIPLEGITDGEHAAKEINRTAAAQFYHQRIIGWEMNEEGFLGIGIGDVVGMANGMVGNGTGGRLMRIDAARTTVETSFAVTDASGSCWVWLLDGTVLNATYILQADGQILLNQALPAAPVDIDETPHSYRIMVFAAPDTPYTKVRITGIAPAGPGRFRYQARDEIPEFYAARVADLSHELIPVEIPYRPCPEGFEVSETAIGVRVASWNEPTRPAWGYELRYGPVGSTWSNMRTLHDGLLPGSPWVAQDLPGEGTWRFGLVAVFPERLEGGSGRRCEVVYTEATLGRPPRPVSGFEEVEVYQVVDANADAPERPTGGQYDFNTATLTPPVGWVGPRFPTYSATQVVYASTATADSAEGNIWTPDANDWSVPVIVGDADDLNIIYRRFDTPPGASDRPMPSSGIPQDAYDLVQDVPDGMGPIYVSIGVRRRHGNLYDWSAWTQLEGQDGTSYRELIAYRRVAVTADAPDRPEDDGSFNFDSGVFTPPANWSATQQTRSQTQKIYAITATADDNDGRLWEAGMNTWVGPILVSDEGDINLIYRRATSLPAEPANSEGTPTDWYDRVSSVPAGDGLIYVSIGVRVRGSKEFNWGAPSRWEAGRGISGVTRSSTGLVTVTYDDGATDSFQVNDGMNGTSVNISQTAEQPDGDLLITFTDGTTVTIPAGEDGDDGATGPAGSAGVGISTITRNLTTGIVTVRLDNGTTRTFALSDGTDGADGSSQEWIYRATTTNTRPATPTGMNTNDFVPPGWNDDPVDGTYVWVSTRRKPAGTNSVWGAFSTPQPFRGEQGPPGPRVWTRLFDNASGATIGEAPNHLEVSALNWSDYDSLVFVAAEIGTGGNLFNSGQVPTGQITTTLGNARVDIGAMVLWLQSIDTNSIRVADEGRHGNLYEVWGVNA